MSVSPHQPRLSAIACIGLGMAVGYWIWTLVKKAFH
jgi:hypothetical protein